MADLVTNQTVLRISSEDAIIDGEEGKLLYRGDLSRRQTFRFTRAVQFWPWGKSSGSIASGRLSIENGDGSYDQLALTDIRNRPAALKVKVGGVTTPIVTPIVDSISSDRDTSVEFNLLDGLARFDVPAVGQFYKAEDGNTSSELEGKPLPTWIGVCRSVPIVLWDPLYNGGAYRCNYAPMTGVGGVFDSGVLLDTTVPQWEFDTRIGNAGVFLNQSTVGKITADGSATGDGTIPDTPTDLMSGHGFFTTPFTEVCNPGSWSGGSNSIADLPEGWNAAAGQSSDGDCIRHLASTATKPARVVMIHEEPSTTQPYGNLGFVFVDDTSVTPFRFVAGTRYRVKFNLVRLAGGWSGTVAGFFKQNPAILAIYTSDGDATGLGSTYRLARYSSFDTTGEAGERSFTFTANSNHNNRPLQFNLSGPFAVAEIADIEIVEVPTAPTETLPGLTLRDYMLEVVRLSGWPVSTVNFDDLDAIDATEESIGFYTESPAQALSLMKKPMDSFTAAPYSDRAGIVRFTRLVDPANETAVFFVSSDNLLRAPTIRLDPAKGLTTTATAQTNFYVHRESELAGLIADLPLEERIKFTQDARITVNATVPDTFPEQYRHAINAPPLATLFDSATPALTEIQRIVDIYSQLRYMIEVEIAITDLSALPEIGMICEFKYHRFGFAEGINMIIASITDIVENQSREYRATMRLWG